MSDGPLTRLLPVALLLAIAVAILLPTLEPLRLPTPKAARVEAFRAALEALPDGALVLVAFDADLGTYAEIRPAARTLLDELLARRARLAFVSFTPEGRALAVAEMERLRADQGEGTDTVLDLGFRTGAEAALVRSVEDILPAAAEGNVAEAVQDRGRGIGAFEAAVIIGGNDLGPRAWVEQVRPRAELPLLAVAPGYLAIELEPYLESGQLSGLLGGVRDGAAFVEDADLGHRTVSATAMMLGMLVAIGVLLQTGGGTLLGAVRGALPRPRE
jgi:hypothetical protein